MLTDIVEVDSFAVYSHGQLWTLPLLGTFRLAPDIANCVRTATCLAVEWSRKRSEHIWLLYVESGSHVRCAVTGGVRAVEHSRCKKSGQFTVTIQKKLKA